MVFTDSSRARSMNAHVFTTRHSASSARSAMGKPASVSSPSISSESTWFFGQPSVVRWTFMGRGEVYRGDYGRPRSAVVRELDGDAEVLLADHRHHLLQVVLALAGDPHLVFLDRG